MAYYGLFRIGELTCSRHTIKACNVRIATTKDKILFILYSSKTHGTSNFPQRVKISRPSGENRKKRHFCPFMLTRQYVKMRGSSWNNDEPFFIHSDHSPVKPAQVRTVLKKTLQSVNLNPTLYNCQSFRIGHASDMFKSQVPISKIKSLGRWRSGAVYKYLKAI